MKRVVTALVLIPFALLTIFFAPPWFYAAVVAAMAVLCYHEFAALAGNHGVKGPLWFGYLAGLGTLVFPDSLRFWPLVLLAAGLTLHDLRSVLPYAGVTLLGVAYIFGAWRCAIDLRTVSPHWILFALAINWASDVAAYYVGRSLGRRKLAPGISPGKSVEGAVGSVTAAVVFGLIFQRYAGLQISVVEMIALSITANVAGQVGDLAESAIKRGAGTKDSGTLLPGHGGFLDRLDSSLFTLPVVYTFVRYGGAWRF